MDDQANGHQPADSFDMHDPNKVGPASAPVAAELSGDPLDDATKAAMDPKTPTPLQGESKPLEPAAA